VWIILNDSFLSIVAHRTRRNFLLVRARRSEDITVIFPGARVETDCGSDYEARAVIKRRVVEDAITGEVARINYTNFKDSVADKRRHDIYLTVWSVLMRLAPRRRPPPPIVPSFWDEWETAPPCPSRNS
jgi:hypothetical protein